MDSPLRSLRRKTQGKKSQGPSTSRREAIPPQVEIPTHDQETLNLRISKFHERPVLPSRYIDFTGLEASNVKRDVLELIDNLGWRKFVYSHHHDGYENLTREVLSSLYIIRKEDGEVGYFGVSFRVQGRLYRLSREEVDDAFGFEWGHPTCPSHVRFNFEEFWGEISTITPYRSNSATAKTLKTLPLFILHRIITHSIHARSEGNEKISKKDVFFLYLATKGIKFSCGFYFMNYLFDLDKRGGHLRVASFVTCLVKKAKALTSQVKNANPQPFHWKCAPLDQEHFEHFSKAILIRDNSIQYLFGENAIGGEIERLARKRRISSTNIEEDVEEAARAMRQEARESWPHMDPHASSSNPQPPFATMSQAQMFETIYGQNVHMMSRMTVLEGEVNTIKEGMTYLKNKFDSHWSFSPSTSPPLNEDPDDDED